MGKSHLKRLNAPKTWPIERKKTKWIAKPRPGSQPLHRTLSIVTIMKEILKVANNSKEVKTILNKKIVKIDEKIRKDPNFSVCVMDVITIQNDNYRLLINSHGKLFLHKIKKEDALVKPKKIIAKKILKGKKLQINFLDGTNLLSTNNNLKVSDTVIFKNNKEDEHLKFEKGALIYLIEGKQVGKIGVIKEIQKNQGLQPTKIIFQSGKENYTTLKSYALVIGKTKPLIDIPNE